MQNNLNLLVVGDVVGRPGRRALYKFLPKLKKDLNLDLIIVNIENASSGFGPTPQTMQELLELPIDVFTTGSHIWDRKEFVNSLNLFPMVLRPANYPEENLGKGFIILEIKNKKVVILQLQGRVFMETIDCPFKKFDNLYSQFPKDSLIIVDFHGEATSEKNAFGQYVDGRAHLVFGTHTHIPTRDERILKNSTIYITDLGMTGCYESVIGFNRDIIISKFLKQTPIKFEVAKGEERISGLYASFSLPDLKPLSFKFIFKPPFSNP